MFIPLINQKAWKILISTPGEEGLPMPLLRRLANADAQAFQPQGPFSARVRMRDGEAAAKKISNRWEYHREGALIFLNATDIQALYLQLIRLCYLTPFILKILPLALWLSNLKGRFGLAWVRRKIRIRHKNRTKRGL
jgi:hypothetical protein